ncbi:MAG: VOC family protein [Nitrosomonadales bacterium]|nr:VOC family protein [Nitrosomonadales bacterium]
MDTPITSGAHHIGLTVSSLEESARFFTDLLGWKEVRRRPDYPAIYVSDGTIMVTLWAIKEEPSAAFDRRKNVGLHHLAFRVASESELNRAYDRLVGDKVVIEFAPEPLGVGPARHMMCYDPSGIRIELIWLGN